jgi:hypothetical protein
MHEKNKISIFFHQKNALQRLSVRFTDYSIFILIMA